MADRACYGMALLGLEELRTPALANGWAGSVLHGRVARLLGSPPRSSFRPAVFLLSFSALRTDEERQQFIGQFWRRRDPSPGTEINEAKEEHYRRIAYSNSRFQEKGRTYILFGPADEIESHPAKNYEQWYYRNIPGVGSNVIFEFGTRRVKP